MVTILAAVTSLRDILSALFFVGFAFAALYGATKLAYTRLAGRPFPRNRVSLFFDGLVEAAPNALGLANKWLQMAGQPPILPPPSGSLPANPYTPEPAPSPAPAPPVTRSGVTLMALALAGSLAFGAGCRPLPPDPTPDDATVVTPSSWTDSARLVVDVIGWVVPGTRVVVSAWSRESPATVARIRTALDAVERVALPSFRAALDAYDRTNASGARCEARAAGRGLLVALVGVADALADAGWGIAAPMGAAIGSLSGVVDALTPACVPTGEDAGFSAPGQDALDHLRDLSRRGLRPFPAVYPPDAN